MAQDPVIEVRDLVVELKGNRVLNGVTLDVYRGEILGFVGASGAGKSVLTRTILGLLPKRLGRISVLSQSDEAGEQQRQEIERRWAFFPAGRFILVIDSRGKYRISDPGISRFVRTPDDRNSHH
jgi:ABC-type transporter Mla maintaining outer membrane lipid asymmetry ATPase subunit MlaF